MNILETMMQEVILLKDLCEQVTIDISSTGDLKVLDCIFSKGKFLFQFILNKLK